jgi:hypothetical protein
MNFHLYWARLLLAHILLGDGFSIDTYIPPFHVSFGTNHQYLSIADCSSFMNELLKFTYHLSDHEFQSLMGTTLADPTAQIYYHQINQGHHFLKINNIHQVQPGDLIILYYPPGSTNQPDPNDPNTGHVMLVNGRVTSMSEKPLINETLQWKVPIIDQGGIHGSGHLDTRSENQRRLGASHFRIYTDSEGLMVGYSWSPQRKSLYYSQQERQIIIGRPLFSGDLGV